MTLPKDVREVKNLRVGDKVLFAIEDDRIEIVKADKNVVRSAAGLWAGTTETGLEYERRLRKGWQKRKVV